MTPQEIFDKAVSTILAQGGPSFDGERCLYRGSNGSVCAIGALIPDSLAEIGDSTVMGVRRLSKEPDFPAHLQDHLRLLRRLQTAHDNAVGAYFMENFLNSAHRAARDFNLTFNYEIPNAR